MLANSILLIMCKCGSGRKTVPQPDQPTHQLTNPTQHEGKEASFMGSMREDGTRTFVVFSCAVGPTGVLWSGICWRWALLITNSRWVSCSPTWDCVNDTLFFKPSIRRAPWLLLLKDSVVQTLGISALKDLSSCSLRWLFCSTFSFACQCLVIRGFKV